MPHKFLFKVELDISTNIKKMQISWAKMQISWARYISTNIKKMQISFWQDWDPVSQEDKNEWCIVDSEIGGGVSWWSHEKPTERCRSTSDVGRVGPSRWRCVEASSWVMRMDPQRETPGRGECAKKYMQNIGSAGMPIFPYGRWTRIP